MNFISMMKKKQKEGINFINNDEINPKIGQNQQPQPQQPQQQLGEIRSRDFSLSLTFRPSAQDIKTTTGLLLSLHAEPAFNFYGEFKQADECTLNGETIVGELVGSDWFFGKNIDDNSQIIIPTNKLSPKLYFPDLIFESRTEYVLKCGKNTGSVRFEPTLGRIDRIVQLQVMSVSLSTSDEEDIPPAINHYTRSIYIPPSSIHTDEERQHKFILLISFISGGIIFGLIFLISFIFCTTCLYKRYKRQKEYEKLVASMSINPDEFGELNYYDYHPFDHLHDDDDDDDGDGDGDAMMYSESDLLPIDGKRGVLNANFETFGAGRNVKTTQNNNGGNKRQTVQPIQPIQPVQPIQPIQDQKQLAESTYDDDNLAILDLNRLNQKNTPAPEMNPSDRFAFPNRHEYNGDSEGLRFSLGQTSDTTSIDRYLQNGQNIFENGSFDPGSFNNAANYGYTQSFKPTSNAITRQTGSTRSNPHNDGFNQNNDQNSQNSKNNQNNRNDDPYDLHDQFSEPV